MWAANLQRAGELIADAAECGAQLLLFAKKCFAVFGNPDWPMWRKEENRGAAGRFTLSRRTRPRSHRCPGWLGRQYSHCPREPGKKAMAALSWCFDDQGGKVGPATTNCICFACGGR